MARQIVLFALLDCSDMAVYLDIHKVGESDLLAEYTYTTVDERVGRFTIDITTGEATLIACAPGEQENRLFARAARKVWLSWKGGSFLIAPIGHHNAQGKPRNSGAGEKVFVELSPSEQQSSVNSSGDEKVLCGPFSSTNLWW